MKIRLNGQLILNEKIHLVDNSLGYMVPDPQRIDIKADLTDDAKVLTFFHELTHLLFALKPKDDDAEERLAEKVEAIVKAAAKRWPAFLCGVCRLAK